jgi:hypothetical protein
MFFEPHHLKDGHDTLTSEQDISNKLGQIFSQNSSTQNYDPKFKKFKKQKEKTSQMSFMRSKRTWSADSGRCLRSW